MRVILVSTWLAAACAPQHLPGVKTGSSLVLPGDPADGSLDPHAADGAGPGPGTDTTAGGGDGLACRSGRAFEDGVCVEVIPETVAAGYEHTCAIMTDGSVHCWGNNMDGQLGDGSRTHRSTPAPVQGLDGGAIAIAAGAFHTCALLADGVVKCWGKNLLHDLGDSLERIHDLLPVDVPGLGNGVTTIAAGSWHMCALLVDGSIRCWGANIYGQIGNGTTGWMSPPTPVIDLAAAAAVAPGETHTCALLADGDVRCWGEGGKEPPGHPYAIPGLDAKATAVTAGDDHACALLAGGGVKCWGRHAYFGQLGNGADKDSDSAVEVLGLGAGVVAVRAGYDHTCALLASGALQCWGYNCCGQLGNGSSTDSVFPVPLKGLGGSVLALVPGGYHTCALLPAGKLQCWGWNESGQLGDGTLENKSTPVYVQGLGE